VNKLKINRKWWLGFIVILIAFYSVATYNRNLVWKTEISLWEDAVKKSPYKARAHYTLGVYYFRAKRYEEAFREYNIALKLKPIYPEAYYRLGEYYFSLRDVEKSIANYKKALQINPEFFEAYLNLGSVYVAARQYKNARECFNNALRFTKDQDYIKNIKAVLEGIKNYE
jgi:tetratricopeptide (TPR) repeat protein